jgi:hypothetical protein
MLGTTRMADGSLLGPVIAAAGLFGAHFACVPIGTYDVPAATSAGGNAAGGDSAGGESPNAGVGGALAGTGGMLAQGGQGGTGGGFNGTGQVPDFSLVDVNATSPTYGDPVSPRDYLMQVSAWYFAHAT